MSPYSAFAYNILNIGVIFPWVYIQTLGMYPGANVWLGIIICGAFTSLLAVVYAGLASAMPRTGGDYVFQSRTLRPWFGFATVAMMIITFFLQWQALAGWLLSVLGVYPLLTGLGVMTNNQTLIAWGAWYLVGWGPAIVTMVASTIAALVLIKSFRWFVQLQWIMWYGFLMSYVIMVVMFFATPHATFVQRFDNASAIVGGGPGAYAAILTNAATAGFTPARSMSILGTLLVTPVALTSLGWVGYAQEQAGEIQGAQSLKNQMFINFGGGVVSMVMMAVLAIAMLQTVDQNWLAAASNAFYAYSGAPAPAIPPWFSVLAIMLTDSPILLFLMIIGIILNAIQVVFNVIVGWTRVAVAMSIDGVLPKFVSHVSPRTHTPVYAHVIFLILGGFLFAYIFNLVPNYQVYTLAVTAVATVMYIGTALGGAVFPWTRREVYRTAPISKFKLGPIPVITICGVIAAAFSAVMLYYFLTVPFLVGVDLSQGISGPGVPFLITVVAIFSGWVVYYFVRRAYLKRVGIDLDLAYKEVPPI